MEHERTTLTPEELKEMDEPCEISRLGELLHIYFSHMLQEDHVFRFDMHYADPEKAMYGTDLVREFGPDILG
jgi:hypothetical protein